MVQGSCQGERKQCPPEFAAAYAHRVTHWNSALPPEDNAENLQVSVAISRHCDSEAQEMVSGSRENAPLRAVMGQRNEA
jgi:hypothetical protein